MPRPALPRSEPRSKPFPARPSASSTPRAAAFLAAIAVCLAPTRARGADPSDHGGHAHGPLHEARTLRTLEEAKKDLERARDSLPPPPSGVTDLRFGALFAPTGPRGLAYSDEARALAGQPVRMLGYMVSQDRPAPGMILLAPFAFQLHEAEYGLAEDLPAAVVHVSVPDRAGEVLPHSPGLLLLTGTLELGPREEPDGRISTVRLRLRPRNEDPSHAANKEENPR